MNYIADGFVGAMLMNPNKFMNSPLGKRIMARPEVKANMGQEDFDPNQVQQVLALMKAPGPTGLEATPAVIIRLVPGVDGAAVMAA